MHYQLSTRNTADNVMDVLLMLIFLSALHVDVAVSNKAEDKLYRHLFRDQQKYLLSIPTAYHTGQTLNVNIRLALRRIIRMDEQLEFLYSQFWLQFTWKDYRLAWNSSAFEGLDAIYIPATNLWMPDVTLYNNAKQQRPGERSPQSEYVRVQHDGTCIWWPMYEESVSHCQIRVTWFPFDDQQCHLIYESWKYNCSQLNITSAVMAYEYYHYQESEQWQLLGIRSEDSTVNYGWSDYSRSTFTIHLSRSYLYYVIHLIVPYCLFSLIAVFAFTLHPSRTERLTLEMTILLTLSVYQLAVSHKLPNKSGSVPLIGVYFMFVMVLCFVALATSIFIVRLYARAIAVPPSPLSPQARRFLCGRLASLLSFQPSNVDEITRRYRDGNSDRGHTDQLDKRQEKSDEDTERREGLLAVAVIDRLCFIALILMFAAGTLVFIVLFMLL